MSTLVKNQKKTFRADYYVDDEPRTLIAVVRHDDECGNGHNSFSITGTLYGPDRCPGETTVKHKDGKMLWCCGGGCIHEEIAKHLPELAPYIKWHLCSTDEPMHYIANAIYHAGDKDCWGLRKDEKRQLRNGGTGQPVWQIIVRDSAGNEIEIGHHNWVDSDIKPEDNLTVAWEPVWKIGEGKERDLDAARHCAIWPEATDDELTAPDLKEKLEARMPQLMADFRAAVEELGFVY